MNQINVELLRKELEFCEANPELHAQNLWATTPDKAAVILASEAHTCGTAACLAGWTALHAGLDLAVGPNGDVTVMNGLRPYEHVRTAAVRLLGLSADDASLLFAPRNSVTTLWCLAHYLTEGAIEIPPAHDVEPYRTGAREQVDWLRSVQREYGI